MRISTNCALKRVLGGENKEGLLEFVGGFANRYRAILHRLQECTLGFGGRAVDLIREKNVGEDGALLKLEGLSAGRGFNNHVGSNNVGRHEVGRELNAREIYVETLAQCLDEHGLAEPRNALEERMTTAQDGHDDAFDDFILADDHGANLVA
mgnify:CR=1 FL=1